MWHVTGITLGHMGSPSNNTTGYTDSKEDVVQYVSDILPLLRKGSVLTMTIRPRPSEGFFVSTIINTPSADKEIQKSLTEPLHTSGMLTPDGPYQPGDLVGASVNLEELDK